MLNEDFLMLSPGYDAWKLAYPPHWDDEPEEEEDERQEEGESQALSGSARCLDCGHVWNADEETACEECGSDHIESLDQ
jgi:hypothetical protein